jgi:AcrR family transcriptional regulator
LPKVTEAHKQARREQITAAALRCFGRDGFHATTMDQIIGEAGLSAGAVYQYFPSKRALILHLAKTVTEGFADLIGREVGREPLEPPAQALPRLVARLTPFLTEHGADKARVALQGWAEATRDPELLEAAQRVAARSRGLMADWLLRWREAGMIDPSVDPALAAPAMQSLLTGILIQRALTADFDQDAYARGMAELIGRGPA